VQKYLQSNNVALGTMDNAINFFLKAVVLWTWLCKKK